MNLKIGKHEVIDMVLVACSSLLYIKNKLSVSNEAFHKLSMESNLPNSSQIKSLTRTQNDDFNIHSTPNDVVGVQQGLQEHIMV